MTRSHTSVDCFKTTWQTCLACVQCKIPAAFEGAVDINKVQYHKGSISQTQLHSCVGPYQLLLLNYEDFG